MIHAYHNYCYYFVEPIVGVVHASTEGTAVVVVSIVPLLVSFSQLASTTLSTPIGVAIVALVAVVKVVREVVFPQQSYTMMPQPNSWHQPF